MTESVPPLPEPAAPAPAAPPPPPRFRGNAGWVFLAICLFFMFVPLLAAGIIFGAGPLSLAKTVVIPRGAGMHEIAALLEQNGVTHYPLLFRLAARVLAGDAMKAGEYEFPPRESIADAVLMMREGRSVVRNFTAAEGLTSAEIVALLDDVPLAGKVTVLPAEGSLLPETYRYSYGDSRSGIVARMQKAMQAEIAEAWPKRDMAIPLKSPEQAVILASLIEKETARAAERPRIARVFYNRMQQGMKLQSDPTVIYALTQGKHPLERGLSHADMAFASPYNTYVSDGLPPGPICNPGRASIEAALHPEQNDFLYFVADGTGGHVFSKDLSIHNQNVVKWSAIKRQQSEP